MVTAAEAQQDDNAFEIFDHDLQKQMDNAFEIYAILGPWRIGIMHIRLYYYTI